MAKNGEGSKAALSGSGLVRQLWLLALETLTLERSRKISVQLIRSLVVSVIALIADFGLLVILKEVFGLHYLIAATLSFGAGVVINYYLSVWWVFANRKLSSEKKEFLIFVVITTLGLIFNLLIIAGMVNIGKVDYRVGKAVSTIIVFFWNFAARKRILY